MTITIDEPAPPFTLAGGADGPVSMADFAGRKLVVYFYPKDDTPGCTQEAIDFSSLADAFAAADTAVLGISKDSMASHGKFTAKHNLKVALAADPDGSVVDAYGAWVEKSMYGKRYMGIDRSTVLIGRDGRVAEVWRKVKVKDHADAVLKAAQALG